MDKLRSRLVGLAVLGATLCLVLPGLAQATQGALRGSIQTVAPVTIDGSLNATSDHAAVNAQSPNVDAELQADQVETRIEWEAGYINEENPADSRNSYVTGTGADWHNFSAVSLHLSSFPGIPQVLRLPGSAITSVSGQAPGSVTAETVENHTVAEWGHRQDAGTEREVGFYYTLEEPHVSFTGADSAEITGNFTFFVNNVTLEVAHAEGTWSNWTGYQESNPDSPVGPLENPAAKEYEVRSTTIQVTNGTLWINATDAVDLYAKDANASLHGSISAPSVSGELLSDPLRYRYDGDPLRMQGTGHLDLGLASQGASDETTRAPGQASTAPPLVLAPSGSFDVAETSGVQVTETTSAWNPTSWFGQGTWIVLAVLGAVAIGAGVGATAPVRVHGALGAAYEGWRAYQYKRWTLEARMMLEERSYERAEDLLSKAQALDPKAPDAYEGLMDTYDVASEPDKALDVAETAIEEIGRDRVPNTFVRMWMEFASRRGTSEHVVEAWLILADRDPEWAVALYAQGDHAPLHEDERVAAKIEQMRDALLADNPELAAMLEGRSPGTGDDEAPGGPEIA